jgi:hypothetical protein
MAKKKKKNNRKTHETTTGARRVKSQGCMREHEPNLLSRTQTKVPQHRAPSIVLW